jgi:hypothetical protein
MQLYEDCNLATNSSERKPSAHAVKGLSSAVLELCCVLRACYCDDVAVHVRGNS